MRNCPDQYYKNCKNALAKCKTCRAGWGSKGSKLYYDPIEESLDVHPAQTKDPQKSKRIKQARKWEKEEAQSMGAVPTQQSGALRHDGDAQIEINGQKTQIEYKDRGERKSFNLTLKEYKKGRQQGVEIFGVRIKDENGKYHTLYMLDDKLFQELLEKNE